MKLRILTAVKGGIGTQLEREENTEQASVFRRQSHCETSMFSPLTTKRGQSTIIVSHEIHESSIVRNTSKEPYSQNAKTPIPGETPQSAAAQSGHLEN